MMRKSSKKFLSLALVCALALSATACGNKDNNNDNNNNNGGSTPAPTTSGSSSSGTTNPTNAPDTGSSTSSVVKPDKITVMFDGTVVTEANGRAQFEAALEAALGVELEFNQPDHSSYYDVVQSTFAGGQWPDVILLGAAYYATYASAGALADISEYWENSELKASGRFLNTALIDSLYLEGPDGEIGLYGFSPARGNGCVTYVKKAWLDKAGLEVPTNYAEYLNMIKTFTEMDMNDSGDPSNTYGVSAAGLIGNEAPYTNYLPEFYQDAYPDFYQNESGEWVDGFTEDAMAAALLRLKEAYEAGYIDKESVTNGTKDCRNKFFDDKFGVFTYWAGTWGENLANSLASNGKDDELVILPPIAELGAYVERQAPVWCITSKCSNPEGVFKYFIESMLDGGEVQTLWTYGVKGVHWDTKAETITLNAGTDSEKSYTSAEGEFHFLENLETPGSLYKKNHIDPMLSLATFVDEDPGINKISDRAAASASAFNDYCVAAPVIVSNDTINSYTGDIWDAKKYVVSQVVTQGMSVEDGMAYYNNQVGSLVQECLDSLNNK